MIQICAWCEQEGQQDLQEPSPASPSRLVSHGICRTHALRLRNTYRQNLLRRSSSPSPQSPNTVLY